MEFTTARQTVCGVVCCWFVVFLVCGGCIMREYKIKRMIRYRRLQDLINQFASREFESYYQVVNEYHLILKFIESYTAVLPRMTYRYFRVQALAVVRGYWNLYHSSNNYYINERRF